MSYSKYKSYDPEIKRQIMESGNPNLFPELNIPRTTALYWICRAKKINTKVHVNKSLYDKIARLEKELVKQRQKVMYLEKHIEIIGKIDEYKIKKKSRGEVVANIQSYEKKIGTGKCLRSTGISRGCYDRWRLKHYKCKKTGTFVCGKSRGNQLTIEEQRVLRKMASSKRYSHMSVKSLQLYCMRKNIICCSLDSWYKYILLFGIDRSRFCKKTKKKYGDGIRAEYPNQVWHVDVTQIKVAGGKKVYLQVIIDNFSRYVVSWRLTDSISADGSVETIRNALEVGSASSLMMDGGSENTNRKVKRLLLHQNIKRVISKQDVKWSNSIVEALFRSLKNNYLYSKVCRTLEDVKRRVMFYFKQHNSVIPHSSFDGATPQELYREKWNQDKEKNLAKRIQFSLVQRIFENRKVNCCLSR